VAAGVVAAFGSFGVTFADSVDLPVVDPPYSWPQTLVMEAFLDSAPPLPFSAFSGVSQNRFRN
jgi:hypothetical protein